MRFIFNYPEPHGGDTDFFAAGRLRTVARAAEAGGWQAFALSEHPAPGARWLSRGGHQTLDPLVALAAVAGATEQLELLTCLVVAAYRNPLVLAKAAATLDLASDGRLILGLGAGYQKSEFHAVGAEFGRRGALLDEALEVLALHWAGEPFSYEGQNFSARDVIGLPAPRRAIPIWLGGNAEPTRRRVARSAQGWMPLLGSVDTMSTTGAPVVEGDAALRAAITSIREQAPGRAGALSVAVSYHELDELRPPDVTRHRDRIAELAELGVTDVILSTGSTSEKTTLEFLERVGDGLIR